MKLIRLLPILLLIGLSCLTSCQKEEIPSADNERTLFMYLPWSTNLTNYFYQNIDDMEDAISRRGLDKERVLVFLSTSSTEAELFLYNPQNEKMRVSETKGLKNPQIPKTKRLLFIQTHKRQRNPKTTRFPASCFIHSIQTEHHLYRKSN